MESRANSSGINHTLPSNPEDEPSWQQLLLQATALDKAANAILITNERGRIVWVNPAFTTLTGFELEEVFGDTPSRYNSGNQPPEFYQRLWQAILSGQTFQGEFLNRRKDGSLYYCEQTITPVSAEPGRITHFIGIINDVTERKRAEEETRQCSNQLRALAARLQDGLEQERMRIARELHDDLGGTLSGIDIGLANLRRLLEAQPDNGNRAELCDSIRDIRALTRATAQQVRRLCTELRPSILDHLGLAPAIQWQASEFQARTGINCSVQAPSTDLAVRPEYATALFRIFQEMLTNVARHSEATQVKVSLEKRADHLFLSVHDNGKGIKPQNLKQQKSFGLLGMRERTSMLGGEIHIEGRPKAGTTVRVNLPGAFLAVNTKKDI